MRTQKEGNTLTRIVILLLAMIALTAAPTAIATAQTSAVVDVMLTILPYAEVTLDSDVTVDLPAAGGSSDPAYVAGTVTTNCSVTLTATIVKPAEAPGTWSVTLLGTAAQVGGPGPGVHEYGQLLRIDVADIPSGDAQSLTLDVFGSKLGETPTAAAGQVVVTVMQN